MAKIVIKEFVAKQKETIEACVIDEALAQFMVASGYKRPKLGDYYINGFMKEFTVWPKKAFEARFEILAGGKETYEHVPDPEPEVTLDPDDGPVYA